MCAVWGACLADAEFPQSECKSVGARKVGGRPRVGRDPTRSHVATVFSNALREFRKVRKFVSVEQSLEVAKRGARVAANRMHEQLRQGISGLRTIALTAQFVGLFGTATKSLDWFRGYEGDRYTHVLLSFRTTAEALVPTALGLVVGIVAVWWFNWRIDRLAVLDTQMRVATLDVVKLLEQRRRTGKS